MTFTVKAQGLSVTKSDSIAVIQDSKIFVEFTPESSVFVRGVENQVFFESWVDENQSEHADFSDASLIEIDDTKERTLQTSINTLFNGRGFFFFTPLEKKEYVLSIQTNKGKKPARVPIPMPDVKSS